MKMLFLFALIAGSLLAIEPAVGHGNKPPNDPAPSEPDPRSPPDPQESEEPAPSAPGGRDQPGPPDPGSPGEPPGRNPPESEPGVTNTPPSFQASGGRGSGEHECDLAYWLVNWRCEPEVVAAPANGPPLMLVPPPEVPRMLEAAAAAWEAACIEFQQAEDVLIHDRKVGRTKNPCTVSIPPHLSADERAALRKRLEAETERYQEARLRVATLDVRPNVPVPMALSTQEPCPGPYQLASACQ